MATPAQMAINKKTGSLVSELARPWSSSDMVSLISHLKKCKSDSIWGLAIRKVLDGGERLQPLIESLASQAIDDFIGMAEIVGITATLLLLRYYDTKNPR